MLTGQNLAEWWGGGIEIAVLREAKFVKLGNVLDTIWIVEYSDKARLWLRPIFLKYDYFHDVLVIQSLSGENLNLLNRL